MSHELPKAYNPADHEADIYRRWEDSGYFNPETLIEQGIIPEDADAFTIMMPPPNVTGVLHMGHALGNTLQDVMIRTARMQGRRALYLPGTDHAAIATQAKVEKEIYKKEGKSRHDLGRDELLRRIEDFVKESHATITQQTRALGASCDWSREAFTLDVVRTKAVRTVFTKMYEDGLIYRGYRVVNWDPKGQTTISDDEIVYEERTAQLYTFRYGPDFPIAIATTRPETKVGDTAVAVHPDDRRYQQFIGQEFDVVFCGVPLHVKIIADPSVDPNFGTGALGVTPAHSLIDWEMAQRHDLPVLPIINEYAKMTVGGEAILGKKTTEARAVIVEWLKETNLLEKEETVPQNVATAERTGGIIEPLPKLQWFIDVDRPFILKHSQIDGLPSGSEVTLKDLMRRVVENNQVKILPAHFEKIYFHWIENLRDWCISRQIWYGHRIPVWYRGEEIAVGLDAPKGDGWEQDPDTLDTWFSSGLWTFSALGWPDNTKDLTMYHPTTVLETAYEILFFWVARMILMTGYTLGTPPFQTVYLHGIVRDTQGRKLSKSLGNGIDPIEAITKYGADACRMGLVVANTPGTDSTLSEEKIRGYQHFANKLWNIARFVLLRTDADSSFVDASYTTSDQQKLDEFVVVAGEVTEDIKNFRMYLAAEKLYHYLWHTFADKILEEAKPALAAPKTPEYASARRLLLTILGDGLKLLHPFMPFVTEAIWQYLPQAKIEPLLMVAKWPVSRETTS